VRERPVICMITDHPGLTTGFANASRPLAIALAEAEFDVHVLGRMSADPTLPKDGWPFTLWPCHPNDQLGYLTANQMINEAKPDLVWSITSPGNLALYFDETKTGLFELQKMIGFKIINYPPVENLPIRPMFKELFGMIQERRGYNIFWTKGSSDALGQLSDGYIEFGLDHAPFRKYPAEDKQLIREAVGLEDRFLVGSVGVNKRTKGHADTIQVAAILKDMGHDDVLFYLHCDPENSAMEGLNLIELAKNYGVMDMVIWPPDNNARDRGNYWVGVKRDGNMLGALKENPLQAQDKDWQKWVFGNLSFIDRLNIFDLYLDVSQVEGWGLPVGEAMGCGTPVLGVKDYWVRDELYGDARIEIEPLPQRMWDYWQTGARLVKVDPLNVANRIVGIKDDPACLAEYSKRGLAKYQEYKWEDHLKEMIDFIRRAL